MLSKLTRLGKAAGGKITRARVLLKADAGECGLGWTDQRIAEALVGWRHASVTDRRILGLLEIRG